MVTTDHSPVGAALPGMNGRARLADWLKRTYFTQAEAARLIGITESQFSQFLSGRSSPSLLNAVRIQKATGIPVDLWEK